MFKIWILGTECRLDAIAQKKKKKKEISITKIDL